MINNCLVSYIFARYYCNSHFILYFGSLLSNCAAREVSANQRFAACSPTSRAVTFDSRESLWRFNIASRTLAKDSLDARKACYIACVRADGDQSVSSSGKRLVSLQSQQVG
jgi:hypothetical protein